MIRVFPRRTKWTPTDKLAFIGDPPLFRPPEQPVAISVTFAWDIREAERLYRSWSRFYPRVELGGPAFGDPGGAFVPGRFVKEGVTITSRGCPKECPFCLVPGREGALRELPIMWGWNVADNNLLACSTEHVHDVFSMLREQPEPVRFSGGLDAQFLTEHHVDMLKSIRLHHAYFAADTPGSMGYLERVADLMSDFHKNQKRCYVLIGFGGESIRQAGKRLENVYRLGFLPFAMLYRSEESTGWSKDWRMLQRTWSRPAAFESLMKAAGVEEG